MRAHRLVAFVCIAVLADAGCNSTTQSVCNPPCRQNFACVGGTCMSACNPACPAGQTCIATGSSAMCVAGTDGATEAGDAIGDAPTIDVPVGIDSPMDTSDAAPVDVVASETLDAVDNTPIDAPVTDASDVGADNPDAPPPCGHAGQSCCGTTFCLPGAVCMGGMCHAYTRAANECTRPTDCTSPMVCAGPGTCGDHGCFTCSAPIGAGAFGAACTSGADCRTGLCRANHCTIPCAIGGTGDADCAAMAPGYTCEETIWASGPMGMTTYTTLGVCRQGCARNGDCTAPQVCLPYLNFTQDRMDFACGMSGNMAVAGTTCTSGSTCQSYLCWPGAGPMGMGACTAPCVSNADCPSGAPMCVPIDWLRPSGTGSTPGHGCHP